jgi:hypothetical protein
MVAVISFYDYETNYIRRAITNNRTYIDSFKHNEVKDNPQEFWYNRPIYSGYRRKVCRTLRFFNYKTIRKSFMDKAEELAHIEFIIIINNNHLEKGNIPILKYSDQWTRLSYRNFLQMPDSGNEEPINVAMIIFLDAEVPIIRRPIKMEPRWFEDSLYEKHQDLWEMEYFLMKLGEPTMSTHLKKEYDKHGVNIKTSICGWRLIRQFLNKHPLNWLLFFFVQDWKL